MKVLVDNNLSPRLVEALCDLDFDCHHVREFNLAGATDEELIRFAVSDGFIILTADSDFGELLALNGLPGPSILYLTGHYPTDPVRLAVLVGNVILEHAAAIEAGCIASIDAMRVRLRSLPFGTI